MVMGFEDLVALSGDAAGGWTAPPAPRTDEPRLFGGLLIAQAIVATSYDTRRCHSLHAYFIGVGDMDKPFAIVAERTRDGRSFATRRFDIHQEDRLLLVGHSSHHCGDNGPDHQVDMPDVPAPEDLQDQREIRIRQAESEGKPFRRYLADEMMDARPIELRPNGVEARRAIWFRPRAPIQGGPALHQAAIGFASDTGLVHVGLLTHARSGGPGVQATSLDHAIWFHRDADANEWMLHVQHSATNAHGRGLSRAEIFSRDGKLVASVGQEFLARHKRSRATPAP